MKKEEEEEEGGGGGRRRRKKKKRKRKRRKRRRKKRRGKKKGKRKRRRRGCAINDAKLGVEQASLATLARMELTFCVNPTRGSLRKTHRCSPYSFFLFPFPFSFLCSQSGPHLRPVKRKTNPKP